jgi:hypothetical protein
MQSEHNFYRGTPESALIRRETVGQDPWIDRLEKVMDAKALEMQKMLTKFQSIFEQIDVLDWTQPEKFMGWEERHGLDSAITAKAVKLWQEGKRATLH